jgi:type IV pilus assembly protein PilA
MSILSIITDRTRRDGRRGFTLLELILVLLMLAVLSAIAVPVYNTVKENSVERVVQTTLENIESNGEAIAVSDPNLNDDQIAIAALAEVDPKDGMTITRNGSEITVEHTSGTITETGSVTFTDGVGAISGPSGGGGGGLVVVNLAGRTWDPNYGGSAVWNSSYSVLTLHSGSNYAYFMPSQFIVGDCSFPESAVQYDADPTVAPGANVVTTIC